MAKELDLILDYERVRREIKSINDKIKLSIYDYAASSLKCKSPVWNTQHFYDPCITAVWEYNKLESHYKDEQEEPWLCESCRLTQDLINQRKAAKKRFGIAKMRISRFASDYMKTVSEK